MLTSLQDFGFVPFFARQVSPDELERDRVGRVVEVQRSIFIVSDGTGERSVSLISALRNAAPEYRPTVGDWVVLDESCSRVERVLDRKSEFRRLAAGEKSEIQLIAANVDILFVVTSCNEEFKESRLERYLALAHEAGTIPVIVLTKIDLSDDPDSYAERANGHLRRHIRLARARQHGGVGGIVWCRQVHNTEYDGRETGRCYGRYP
jgi:ribosome biogenesis GTPase